MKHNEKRDNVYKDIWFWNFSLLDRILKNVFDTNIQNN